MTAYGLSRFTFKGRDTLFFLVLMLMTAVMGAAVWAVGLLPLGNLPMLLAQAAVGVGVYAALSLAIKPEAYVAMLDMLAALRKRNALPPQTTQ